MKIIPFEMMAVIDNLDLFWGRLPLDILNDIHTFTE